jgi:predicted GIY-YIG superfamily endonuclease
MEYIYILKLINNKYYIGKTTDVENRYQQHISGLGSIWTKKYKPLSIIKQVKSSSKFDEDKYVKEYMSIYGIENVRGGTYASIKLDTNSIVSLQKELWHSKEACIRCGRDSHFVKDCYAKTDINNNSIKDQIPDSKTSIVNKIKPKNQCVICGKTGHREINCMLF